MQQQGETMQRQGGLVITKGASSQRQGETMQRQGETMQRQGGTRPSPRLLLRVHRMGRRGIGTTRRPTLPVRGRRARGILPVNHSVSGQTGGNKRPSGIQPGFHAGRGLTPLINIIRIQFITPGGRNFRAASLTTTTRKGAAAIGTLNKEMVTSRVGAIHMVVAGVAALVTHRQNVVADPLTHPVVEHKILSQKPIREILCPNLPVS